MMFKFIMGFFAQAALNLVAVKTGQYQLGDPTRPLWEEAYELLFDTNFWRHMKGF